MEPKIDSTKLFRFETKKKPKVSYNDEEEEENEDLFETKVRNSKEKKNRKN